MSHAPIRLGIPDDEYLRPLFETVKEFCRQKAETSPEYSGLSFVPCLNAAERLLNDEVDAAVLSALDYARNSSDVSLYAGFAVSSGGESRLARLVIRSDIRSIARLALGPVSPQDAVLAKIILSEQFEQDAELISTEGDVPALLQRADAVVVGGDAALGLDLDLPMIDLAGEWTAMTELPYVHWLCAGKKWSECSLLTRIFVEMDAGDDLLPDQAALGFGDAERAGLSEFYRYCFYSGILPDVPDIEVFEQ
jgi:predicted solute-binding protein